MTAIASAETGDNGRVDDKPILELRNLKKDYGPVHALRPATLSFKRGEIHAIVGENGAGKSTLIKLLTGVIRRSGGEILWEGKPVALVDPAGIDRSRDRRRPPGNAALPSFDGRRQHVPRRGEDPLRAHAQEGHDARNRARHGRHRLSPAGGCGARHLDHRPAATGRHRTRLLAWHQVPDLRRAHRLSDAPGGGAAVRDDPPPARRGRHHHLHLAPARGSVRDRRSGFGAA